MHMNISHPRSATTALRTAPFLGKPANRPVLRFPLKQMMSALNQWLFCPPSRSEIIITWDESNGDESGMWAVYDRTTDQRYQFESEQAVRMWVEQRYAQKSPAFTPYMRNQGLFDPTF